MVAVTDKQLVTLSSDQTWLAILLQNLYSALNLTYWDLSFLILATGQHALRSLMNKCRSLEYINVTSLGVALVYQFVYPIFLGRLSSITIFTLLVPLLIYWVVSEWLLVWSDDGIDYK